MLKHDVHSRTEHSTAAVPWLIAYTLIALACLAAMAACAVQIGSPSPSATSGPGTTVQVKIAQGQGGSTLILMPVTINGKGPYTFALDTGASTSLIDKPLAQRLSLPQAGSPQTIAGINGQEQAVPVRIKQWHVEKITLPQSTVASASLFDSQRSSGIQGLLGSDIWKTFGKITIDYTAGTVTTYQSAAQSRSEPRILNTTAALRRLPRVIIRKVALHV